MSQFTNGNVQIDIKSNLVCDAAGSVMLTYNGATVIAAVHGPTILPASAGASISSRGELQVVVGYTNHASNIALESDSYTSSGVNSSSSSNTSSGSNSSNARDDMAAKVRDSLFSQIQLEHYSGASILITCQVIRSNDPYDLGCIITAASAALCMAKIELVDVVTAACVPVIDSNKMEVTNENSTQLQPYITVAYSAALQEVFAFHSHCLGASDAQTLIASSQQAVEDCVFIRKAIRDWLVKAQ